MHVFFLLNTKEDILKNVGNRAVLGHSIFFPTSEVNGAPKQPGYTLSSKYLPLYSAEKRHAYRFGSTWGWVNDDWIFIFGWTIPLIINTIKHLLKNLKNVNCKMFHFIIFFRLYRVKKAFGGFFSYRYNSLCHLKWPCAFFLLRKENLSTSLSGRK